MKAMKRNRERVRKKVVKDGVIVSHGHPDQQNRIIQHVHCFVIVSDCAFMLFQKVNDKTLVDKFKLWIMSDFPRKCLNDIIMSPDDVDTDKLPNEFTASSRGPSVIINDWLFLGNCQNAMDRKMLNKLGITHILNVTRNIPCYHIRSDPKHAQIFKYAQIPIDDVESANLFEYLEAACCFIDECNPFYYQRDSEVVAEMESNLEWTPPKILVHCAAGISRSSSTVISYLMSRRIRFNEIEQRKLKFIAKTLEYGRNQYDGLRLSESFYFVQSCRSQIRPNNGFMAQLEKFERIHHGDCTTTNDINYFPIIPYEAVQFANGKGSIESVTASDKQQTSCCAIL